MTTAVGNQSRAIHRAVTDLVTTYLDQSGFEGVSARPYHRRISDALTADLTAGDVRGLEGVHMLVTSRQTHRLDVDLDRARVGADVSGQAIACVIQWRGDRSVDQSFAVLSLRDLARLMGGSPPPP